MCRGGGGTKNKAHEDYHVKCKLWKYSLFHLKNFNNMPAFQNGGVPLFMYLFIKPIQDRHGNMLNHLLDVVWKQLHSKCYKTYI
jgi:hypothetical protein